MDLTADCLWFADGGEKQQYKLRTDELTFSPDSPHEQVFFSAWKVWPQDLLLGRDDQHTDREEINHTTLDEWALASQSLPAQMSEVDRPEEFHPGHHNPKCSTTGSAFCTCGCCAVTTRYIEFECGVLAHGA